MTGPDSPPTILRHMSTDAAAGSGPTGSGAPPNDWAAQATAKIDEVVSIVRDKTVRPVGRVVRILILAFLTASVGALLAVLFAVGVVRVLDTEVFHAHVWASYLVVGGIFLLAGLFLSRVGRGQD